MVTSLTPVTSPTPGASLTPVASPTPGASPSRRDLLRLTGGLGAAAMVGTGTSLAASSPAHAAGGHLPGSAFVPGDQDTHLLRRATYGPTPASLAALRRMGRAGWLDRQLDPSSIDDASCQRLVNERLPELSWSMAKVRARRSQDRVWFTFELGMAAIARAAWSNRQLFEVMVDFWANHLNVTTSSTSGAWYARPHYDRTVIRRHALGRFEDMLVASAKHPAMLVYLNNAESTKVEPNENYGRELLELHTVGVDGGYSEPEMYQSALIMTGFRLDAEGEYAYDAAAHHTGPVSVLGFADPNPTGVGGEAVGVAYLRYLANHPATARQLARKLCVRFVCDQPDDALVQRLADIYLANGTAIIPVLRELFTSPEFAGSIGQKVRRPTEDIIAAVRILGIKHERKGTTGLRSLYSICGRLGHAPYAWHLPDGYPDDAGTWVSAGAMLSRWNRHLGLAGGYFPKELQNPSLRTLLPKRLPKTHGDLVDVLARRLVFRALRPEHRSAVLQFLEARASDPLDKKSGAVNWRLPSLVALILDSPYHGIR